MQLEIKNIVNSLKRFREATLESKFTEEQKEYIRTFPGASFKEQLFRCSGLGKCKKCNNDTRYAEKMRFDDFCSAECRNQPRRQFIREEKLLILQELLKQYDLTLLDPENYINALSSLNFHCNKCTKNFKTQHDRALRHTCNRTYGPAPKFKLPKIKKEHVKKIKVNDKKCIKCGSERHPKSKPGMCKSCFLQSKRERMSQQHLEQLLDLGYTTTATEIWDGHLKYEFKNLECGHIFEANLGNVLNRMSVCGICGPKRRQESMLSGYMRKYARDYDLKELEDYTKYVRGLSNNNWAIANEDSSDRGHVEMHLDHKIPISYGFRNKIPPEAIADIENLELLSYNANLTKGSKMYRFDILEILKQKYDFSAYTPDIVKALSFKTEKLLSYIKLLPTSINDDEISYGNTILKIIHFNVPTSAGNLVNKADNNYMIVFEDELVDNRRRIIESMLNYSMGNSRKIFARKCIIKEISAVQSDRFMHVNHLGGRIVSSYRLGLFLENDLVAVMLFCKSRFMKDYEWELLRFANKLDISVVGGVSRLFSYFIKEKSPVSIMSYADKRFGNKGSVYEVIGMMHIKSTTPSTWWIKNGVRISSQDTRYEKLPKLLGKDFNNLVGIETNMLNNGWLKFEDLGSNVYGWEASNARMDRESVKG